MNEQQIADAMKAGDMEHVVAVFRAMRDFNVPVLIVPPSDRPIDFRGTTNQRPFIAMISDDHEQALGPDSFHKPSLTALVKMADHAAVVSSAPVADLYRMLSLMPSYLRTGSIIVETKPSQDVAWVRFLRKLKPELPILLNMPEKHRLQVAE